MVGDKSEAIFLLDRELASAGRKTSRTAEDPRARTAVLATVRADGRPHVAPIWFDLNDDVLIFTTGENTVKARNMRRDPRRQLLIDEEEPPTSSRSKAPRTECRGSGPSSGRPASAAAIWVQTGPMSTAVATRWRASCWCGSPRRRSSPTRTSLIDMLLVGTL